MFACASAQTIAEKMQRYRQWSICFLILLGMYTEVAALLRPGDLIKEDAFLTCQKKNLTVYNTSSHPCCTCPIGQHLAHDCSFSHPETTRCEACLFDEANPDKQTFMDELNNATSCKPALNKTACVGIMNTHRVAGSTKTNARCGCEPGFLAHRESIEFGCFPPSPCSPGFFAKRLASDMSDTICRRCPPGTFNNVTSPTATCKKFSSCPGGVILQSGSSTQDVVCNRQNMESTVTTTVMSAITQPTMVSSPADPDSTPGSQACDNSLIIIISLLLAGYFCLIIWCLCKSIGDDNDASSPEGNNGGTEPGRPRNHRNGHMAALTAFPVANGVTSEQFELERLLSTRRENIDPDRNDGSGANGHVIAAPRTSSESDDRSPEENTVDLPSLPTRAVSSPEIPSQLPLSLTSDESNDVRTSEGTVNGEPQADAKEGASGDSLTSPKGLVQGMADYNHFKGDMEDQSTL